MFRSSYPGRDRSFAFFRKCRPSPGPIHCPSQSVPGIITAVRRFVLDAEHSSSCSVEVKNEWSYASPLPVCLHFAERSNFMIIVIMFTISITLVWYKKGGVVDKKFAVNRNEQRQSSKQFFTYISPKSKEPTKKFASRFLPWWQAVSHLSNLYQWTIFPCAQSFHSSLTLHFLNHGQNLEVSCWRKKSLLTFKPITICCDAMHPSEPEPVLVFLSPFPTNCRVDVLITNWHLPKKKWKP
jgi:hypothetical protein